MYNRCLFRVKGTVAKLVLGNGSRKNFFGSEFKLTDRDQLIYVAMNFTVALAKYSLTLSIDYVSFDLFYANHLSHLEGVV